MKPKDWIFSGLFFLLLLGLLLSCVTAVERYAVEKENRVVDLVLDYESFYELVREYRLEEESFLQGLAERGITSVSFYELTLEDLVKRNQALFTPTERFFELYHLAGIQFPSLEPEEDFLTGREDGTFLFTPSKAVATFLKESLALREERELHILHQEEHSYFFFLDRPSSSLKDLPLGFLDDHHFFQKMGLHPFPRIWNQDREDETILIDIWQDVYPYPSTIIFGGSEVFGFEDHLPLTASLIQEGGHLLGVIESFIAKQRGIGELARYLDSRITRVHSIRKEEMAILSEERVINRFLRAVRERNVRTLYLRLFPVPHLEDNYLFLENLVTTLEENGYSIGRAKPFPPFEASMLRLFLINLGVLAGALLLLRFFTKKQGPTYLFFILGILFSLLTLLFGLLNFNQQVMGLLTAIIFPTYGILLVMRELMKGQKRSGFFSVLALSFYVLFFSTLFSLVGSLLIIGLFGDLSYLLQVDSFRGIKLAFLLPLLILAFGFIHQNQGLPWKGEDIRKLLNKPICFKHLFYGSFLFLAAFIYLARTGNFPLIPVPDLEVILREELESIMVFRPRFKEFFVGHPFLILAPLFSMHRKVIPLFLILGSIGQLSIVNSFAHLHTPLLVSFFRTIGGLFLGILFGVILLLIAYRGSILWYTKEERRLS